MKKSEAINAKIKKVKNQIEKINDSLDDKNEQLKKLRKVLKTIKDGTYKPSIIDKIIYDDEVKIDLDAVPSVEEKKTKATKTKKSTKKTVAKRNKKKA